MQYHSVHLPYYYMQKKNKKKLSQPDNNKKKKDIQEHIETDRISSKRTQLYKYQMSDDRLNKNNVLFVKH